MRYNWVQWHVKAKDGQRDFTLKRKGTRDYMHSVKNRSKYSTRKYTPSDSAMISQSSQASIYKINDQNQNNIDIRKIRGPSESYEIPSSRYKFQPSFDRPLRITSMIERSEAPNNFKHPNRATYISDHKLNLNPMVNLHKLEEQNDGNASEGYGTFRNGPYIIEGEDLDHICHRRNSAYSEQATEL